jgi:DNA-3-methyladenine glycosylase II
MPDQTLAKHRKALAHLRRSADPVMHHLIATLPPCTLGSTPVTQSLLWALTRAIIYQRISLKAAATVHQRFLNHYGSGEYGSSEYGSSEYGSSEASAEAIFNTDFQTLRNLGLPTAKVMAIQDVAQKVLEGLPDFAVLATWEDEAIIRELTQIRGIGQWSVEMLLMFQLQRWDILPVGDLGLQMAIRDCYGLGGLPKKAQMLEIAEVWRPYRSIATWYLWQSRNESNQAILSSWQ